MTITERNPDGTIKKKVLSSEKAAEMGRRSHAKRSSETANRILAEAGFDADNKAPEHLQVLATYAVSGKSGAVVALRDFRKLTSTEETTIKSDDTCPYLDDCMIYRYRNGDIPKHEVDAAAARLEADEYEDQ